MFPLWKLKLDNLERESSNITRTVNFEIKETTYLSLIAFRFLAHEGDEIG